MARVRFAEHRDLDLIEQIENAADHILIDRLKPDSWFPAPTGLARLAEPGFLLVIERDDGRVAGFVHVLEVEGICHLEQVSVATEYARQGLGRALVKAAKQHARERGYSQISLRTFADVPWNAPFYRTAGFVEEEPVTAFHRSLVDTEARYGLDRYGRRVHMVAPLADERPKVVCLCGSLRFQDLIQSERERLTARGVIVLGPETISEELTPSLRAALGELHLRRIDLADELRVVSRDGYLGSATRREIEYARQQGKSISSVEPNLNL